MIPIGKVWQKLDKDGNTYLEGQFVGTKLISKNCRKLNRFFIMPNNEKVEPDEHDWVFCYDRTDMLLKPPSKVSVIEAEVVARNKYYRDKKRRENKARRVSRKKAYKEFKKKEQEDGE